MDIKTYVRSHPRKKRGELTLILAKKLGISGVYMRMMISGHRNIPAKYAIPLEKATKGNVTRFDIAPYCYKK